MPDECRAADDDDDDDDDATDHHRHDRGLDGGGAEGGAGVVALPRGKRGKIIGRASCNVLTL